MIEAFLFFFPFFLFFIVRSADTYSGFAMLLNDSKDYFIIENLSCYLSQN
jgi:hypothetical protein